MILIPIKKINVSASERFTRPGMGMADVFQVRPHHFLADQPPVRRESAREMLSSFVTVLDKNTIHLTLIALSGFMYLSDDLTITINWYLYNLQSYTVVFFLSKHPQMHSFCSKTWVGWIECGEVGQGICLWFTSQDSCTFMMYY